MSNYKKAQEEIKDILTTGYDINIPYHNNHNHTFEGIYFNITTRIENNEVKEIDEIEYFEEYKNEPITEKQKNTLIELLNDVNEIDTETDAYFDRGIRRTDFF